MQFFNSPFPDPLGPVRWCDPLPEEVQPPVEAAPQEGGHRLHLQKKGQCHEMNTFEILSLHWLWWYSPIFYRFELYVFRNNSCRFHDIAQTL